MTLGSTVRCQGYFEVPGLKRKKETQRVVSVQGSNVRIRRKQLLPLTWLIFLGKLFPADNLKQPTQLVLQLKGSSCKIHYLGLVQTGAGRMFPSWEVSTTYECWELAQLPSPLAKPSEPSLAPFLLVTVPIPRGQEQFFLLLSPCPARAFLSTDSVFSNNNQGPGQGNLSTSTSTVSSGFKAGP